jgi:hypothetical protein
MTRIIIAGKQGWEENEVEIVTRRQRSDVLGVFYPR